MSYDMILYITSHITLDASRVTSRHVICYVMLYYIILHHIILYCIILYHITSHHTTSYIISYHNISYHIIYHISYHIISYHIILYYIILYYIILYYIILYYIILYYIILYYVTISIHELLYFNFFSASFCTTVLSAGTATSISVHVFSFFVFCLLRGRAEKSSARPTSRCHRPESIVTLERGVCSCAELQVFSCYRA